MYVHVVEVGNLFSILCTSHCAIMIPKQSERHRGTLPSLVGQESRECQTNRVGIVFHVLLQIDSPARQKESHYFLCRIGQSKDLMVRMRGIARDLDGAKAQPP